MSVSGLRTSVPGSVRVWSAVADTPQSTQAVSCGSRQRLKGDRGPEKCFFSRQGEKSERSGITVEVGSHCPLGKEQPARGSAQSETVRPHRVPITKNTKSATCTTRERAGPDKRCLLAPFLRTFRCVPSRHSRIARTPLPVPSTFFLRT